MGETVEHGDALGRVLERLEALEAENARLTAEVAALQGQRVPSGPGEPPDADGVARGWTDTALSRRQALRALGGAAAAGAGLAIAGGALTAEPAAASTGAMHYGGTLMDAAG